MKVFVTLSLFFALTLAEPIRQRYYVERAQEEPSEGYQPSGWRPDGPAFNLPQKQYGTPAQAAPQQQYGAPMAPQKQYGVPQKQYGAPAAAPQQQYGAPQQQYNAPAAAPQRQYGTPAVPQRQYSSPAAIPREYGAPEYTTTEYPNDEEPTTVRALEASQSESMNAANELDDDIDARQPQQTGEYYIALPDGRLQRVRYVSRQDAEAMRYFAKIRAENVEPLRGPIYAYAPLKRLEIAGEKLLEVQPVTQLQYQIENQPKVVPVSSSVTAFAANYQAAPEEPRYILSL